MSNATLIVGGPEGSVMAGKQHMYTQEPFKCPKLPLMCVLNSLLMSVSKMKRGWTRLIKSEFHFFFYSCGEPSLLSPLSSPTSTTEKSPYLCFFLLSCFNIAVIFFHLIHSFTAGVFIPVEHTGLTSGSQQMLEACWELSPLDSAAPPLFVLMTLNSP